MRTLQIVETDCRRPTKVAFLFCMGCGDFERHQYQRHMPAMANGRNSGGGYHVMFKCCKCGVVRQWGCDTQLPAGSRTN